MTYFTVYGHMNQLPNLTLGQPVKAGQEIGKVGNNGISTGPHLHFETVDGDTGFNHQIDGTRTGVRGAVNRVNPSTFDFHGDAVFHGAGTSSAPASSMNTLPNPNTLPAPGSNNQPNSSVGQPLHPSPSTAPPSSNTPLGGHGQPLRIHRRSLTLRCKEAIRLRARRCNFIPACPFPTQKGQVRLAVPTVQHL
jgi:hypothetical protein